MDDPTPHTSPLLRGFGELPDNINIQQSNRMPSVSLGDSINKTTNNDNNNDNNNNNSSSKSSMMYASPKRAPVAAESASLSFFEMSMLKREQSVHDMPPRPRPPIPSLPSDVKFRRVVIDGDDPVDFERRQVCVMLNSALLTRSRFIYNPPIDEQQRRDAVGAYEKAPSFSRPDSTVSPASAHTFAWVNGVVHVYASGSGSAGHDEQKSTATMSDAANDGGGGGGGEDQWETVVSKKKRKKKKKGKKSDRALSTRSDDSDASSKGANTASSSSSPPAPTTTTTPHQQQQQHRSSSLFVVPTVEEFWTAMNTVMAVITSGPCKSFCYSRLKIQDGLFNLHLLLNEQLESSEQKLVPHRDFYNVRKIDNHVHHSACMNEKHFLRFIKHKLKATPDEVCHIDSKTGKKMTLSEVFKTVDATARDLSVDMLNMRADTTFQRFDRFNAKYNPLGDTMLREIFLKTKNYLDGKYLAQITKEVMDDLETNKYQFAEYRLSIYGKDVYEWTHLAMWVVDNDLFHHNVRWMIQIPRLFAVYRRAKLLRTFQDMLANIFTPLFEVSIDPSAHPKLHMFLQQCVGFDSVDDESVRDPQYDPETVKEPSDWDDPINPPYTMWAYYLYANLAVLNKLRASKGLSTFAYRPHAGEAGDIDHLAATFITAHSINHGLQLNQSPALQYLYYLAQVGLSMSPLSNNLLFVEYDRNPFYRFFRRGLNVTLSSDDPLMIHVTKEPLVEEYSVAKQVWKLNSADQCEIARNSVLQSGFEHKYKVHWLGEQYESKGIGANDIALTNVPTIRFAFRMETRQRQIEYLWSFLDPAEQRWAP